MDFSTMVDAVQDTVDDTSSSGEARIKRYLNWAQQDIASRKDWHWLKSSKTLTTTSGTEEYSLDSTCHKVIAMKDETNETYLRPINARAFEVSEPYVDTSSDTGKPRYWYPSEIDSSENQQVKFYPVPNGSYTIRYRFYKRLSDMSADTDVSRVPAKYHKLLVDFACGKYLQKEQDPQANHFLVEYENGIANMASDMMAETDAIPSVIPAQHQKQAVRDLRF